MGRTASIQIAPRWRVYLGSEIALGPGKVQLLQAIADSGSLLTAARTLEMSYMRAWKLVQTMNRCFREPLVALARGGKTGGSAKLTPSGSRLLVLYRELEKEALRAAQPALREITRALREG